MLSRRQSFRLAAWIALGSVALSASPAAARPPKLTPEQSSRLEAANAYLTGLKSVQGRFNQVDAQGGETSGTLWLKRPGKARFQYDAPADLLVVSDGANVMVNDRRLKTFDQYPLWATPLGLLLAKQVRLDKGVEITAVTDTVDGFAVTARDGRKQADGAITLRFLAQPITLAGWTVTDGQGQRTQVAIGPLHEVVDPDPALFVLRDPRPRRGKN
jgi:outer membrane lipoprotein-sorting protein